MKVITKVSELVEFLKCDDMKHGCLADTSFLYAISYDDDKFHNQATELFEILAEQRIPIFANVISRLEFIIYYLENKLRMARLSYLIV